MKRISFILSFIAVMILSSCEPQMDKAPGMGAKPSGDFTFDTTDPNYVVFEASSDNGFLLNWDFGNGVTSQNKKDTVYYPFVGDYTVTLTISGEGGATDIQKTVTITANDPGVGQIPGLKELTGEGLGKTWEYNDVVNNDSEGYCYMTANYDWEEAWWNPYEGDPSPERDAKMYFDLDGGFNYTYIAPDGTESKGSFVLDMKNMTLKIIDAQIPDQHEENCDPAVTETGIYQVKILKEHSLFLWQDQSAMHPDDYDYGWAWKFKESGFTPPEPTGDFTYSIDGNTVTFTASYDEYTNSVSWDFGYNDETDTGDEVEFYYPFGGDYEVTMTLNGDGGSSEVTKKVHIDADDPELGQQDGLKELTNGGVGKVWEFDTNYDEGYTYMTANYDWEEVWENPYEDEPCEEAGYQMMFDLKGGYNYTLIADDGTETTGEFILDMDNMTLRILPAGKAHIPNQYDENCDISVTSYGLFDVKILKDGSLVLWQDQSQYHPDEYDFGWVWRFKSAGPKEN
jgi:PKD repeat protein